MTAHEQDDAASDELLRTAVLTFEVIQDPEIAVITATTLLALILATVDPHQVRAAGEFLLEEAIARLDRVNKAAGGK